MQALCAGAWQAPRLATGSACSRQNVSRPVVLAPKRPARGRALTTAVRAAHKPPIQQMLVGSDLCYSNIKCTAMHRPSTCVRPLHVTARSAGNFAVPEFGWGLPECMRMGFCGCMCTHCQGPPHLGQNGCERPHGILIGSARVSCWASWRGQAKQPVQWFGAGEQGTCNHT